jgi:hypothetical protein
MGDTPSPILPVPKHARLERRPRREIQRYEITCDAPDAKPLITAFAECAKSRAGLTIPLHLLTLPGTDGAYQMHLKEDGMEIRATGTTGFRHALASFRQLCGVAAAWVGEIHDAPSLAVRGFHLNFDAYRRMTLDDALRLVEFAARLKLNTLLVEYGPRFPFDRHADVCDESALSTDDVARLVRTADDLGIQLVPLQQTFAHLEYVLRLGRHAPLRERPERDNLLCPSRPESMTLVKSLLREVMDRHPQSRWIHLGADEARKVGRCPACQAAVAREGIGALIGRYLGELTRWVLEQGRRPVVWDDTLCAHPDALDHLPRETIIQYWDYIAVADPTPVLIPRMAHAWGGPRVAHDWRWALPRQQSRLSEAQRDVMRAYSRASKLTSSLGKDYLRFFRPYLGDGFPKRIRALPYLEFYQDRGFDVITSPTGLGNGDTADGVPNFRRFECNIRTHASRCKENSRALGMISTAWYNLPPEVLYHPMILTAQYAW